MKKYIKYNSLTWWAAIVEAVINILRVSGVEIPGAVDGIILSVFGVGLRGAIDDKKPTKRR